MRLAKLIISSAAFSLVVTLVIAALAVYGIINIGAARFLLFVAWLIGTAGVVTSETVCSKPWKRTVLVGSFFAAIFGGGLAWLDHWAISEKAQQEALTTPPPTKPPSATTLALQKSRQPAQRLTATVVSGSHVQQHSEGDNSPNIIGSGNTVTINPLLPKSETPAFAVAVESKLLVPSPVKEEAGTGFWGMSAVGANCFLRSADVVMLIRIKSLEPIKTMITAYNVQGIGGELNRIKMTTNRPFAVFKKGVITLQSFQGKFSYPIPAPSGNVGGGFYIAKFAELDFSVAVPIQDDILDSEIADHYMEPGDTVRGWAFFEYPNVGALPVRLTLRISDDLGHTFSYQIPDEPGNPTGDALRRVITFTGPPVNLSSCTRLPHPGPLP
jgi:hypothetical protein